MAKMKLSVQGVRGGNFKNYSAGYVKIATAKMEVGVDGYLGTGNSYRPRKEGRELVNITFDGVNYFNGPAENLRKILRAGRDRFDEILSELESWAQVNIEDFKYTLLKDCAFFIIEKMIDEDKDYMELFDKYAKWFLTREDD